MDSDLVASESGDNLKELEELQRKIELEAEERKLEENLESQRQLENEAKQKLLAVQRRRNAATGFQDAENCFNDLSFEHGISGAVHCKQV